MTARLTFLAIAAFWVTMNVLLWQAEFGAHGNDTPVPLELVWKKILTAPDVSSLNVYQKGDRTGYCEFSTSVGQQMAALDEDKVPPEGWAAHAGYQVHFTGNISLGDFTNRVKFDGRIQFNNLRQWRELNLKIISRLALVEIHARAANQTLHLKLSNGGAMMEHDFTFADLQNPNALFHALAGNFADTLFGGVDLPQLTPAVAAQKIQWNASRTRVRIGSEAVPVYRLETSMLGYTVTVDVSTLGEILRIELPGNISARIDEWSKP
jgi:hypothetical protein